jgi:hypothetical protein
MQAPLAILGFLLGLVAWWETGHFGWVAGAVLMIANWPVTDFAIMPTKNRLMQMDPAADQSTRATIEKWDRLDAIRTGLGFAAALAFVWAFVR